MGNCCNAGGGEKGEDFIKKVMLSLKSVNNFNDKVMLKEFKSVKRDECILIGDFFEYLETILSEDREKGELQKGVFIKYFKATGEKELNINEILLLLIPYFNMNTKDKKYLLKQVLEYLTDEKNINNRNLKVKKRSKREILYFYYHFHTIFLTKSFIFLLNNKYNFLCLNNTEKIKKKNKKDKNKNNSENNNKNNNNVNEDIRNTSSSSDISVKTSADSNKDSKQSQLQSTIDDLYALQFHVFNEENLKKEIDKLFSSQNIHEKVGFNDITDKDIMNVHLSQKQGDSLEYENTLFYSNQIKLIKKRNPNFRGKSKLEYFSFVELTDLRDHFITIYQQNDNTI